MRDTLVILGIVMGGAAVFLTAPRSPMEAVFGGIAVLLLLTAILF